MRGPSEAARNRAAGSLKNAGLRFSSRRGRLASPSGAAALSIGVAAHRATQFVPLQIASVFVAPPPETFAPHMAALASVT